MKALVIGYGVMGKAHARTLRSMRFDVGSIDPSPDAGAVWPSFPLWDADIACIATPPEHLVPKAVAALHHGMDVLVEKPMALSLESAEVLMEAEQESGQVLRVGYLERFNPAVGKLKQALPLIGELRHISVERLGHSPRCTAAGPALDLLIHDIDVLRYLELWPQYLHSTSSPAHVSAHFALATGNATIQASHLHPSKRRTLTAVGDRGMLSLDYQRQTVLLHTEDGAQELDVERREPLALQWQAFLDGKGVRSGEALATLDLALRAASPSASIPA